jgi:hypothetical protein
MMAIYGDSPSFKMEGGESLAKILDEITQGLYKTLSPKQKSLLNKVSVNGFDVIEANSGGHKCITNISGINFMYSKSFSDPKKVVDSNLSPIVNYNGNNKFVKELQGKLIKYGRLSDKQIEVATNQIEKEMGPITPVEEVKDRRFVDLVADIQKEFVSVLKNKVKQSKSVNEGVKRITKAFIKSNPYKIK